MIKKLRVRFVCVSMAIVLLAVSVIFVAILDSTKKSLARECDLFMEQIMTMPHLTVVLGESSSRSFLIVDALDDGTVELFNANGYERPETDSLGEILQQVEGTTSGLLDDHHFVYDSFDLESGTRYFFVDTSNDDSVLSDLSMTLTTVGAISLLVFFLLSIPLSNWAMAPVRIAWAQQKQFISDASHELKTPITIISTNADMIQREPDSALLEQRMEHIQSSADRLRLLTGSLLQLTRAEGSQSLVEKETVNISQILEMESLSFEALFFEKNLSIEYDIASDVTMLGQEGSLRQLIAILLDNAYKYAEPATNVHVVLRPHHGRQYILYVSNQGAPIQKENLENIFHRFYRIDASRGQVEGYGLGLSIARAISDTHGGKLWAESDGGYNTFSFRFFSTVSAS